MVRKADRKKVPKTCVGAGERRRTVPADFSLVRYFIVRSLYSPVRADREPGQDYSLTHCAVIRAKYKLATRTELW